MAPKVGSAAPITAAAPRPVSSATAEAKLSPPAMSIPVPTQQELLAEKSVQAQAALELARQKTRAWNAYYHAPAACDHPVDWNAQVECGNQYMRAKAVFEQQSAKDHGDQGGASNSVVIDNASFNRAGH